MILDLQYLSVGWMSIGDRLHDFTYRLLEAPLVCKECSSSQCSSRVMSVWVGRDWANGSCGGERRGSCNEWVKCARTGDSIPISLKRALGRLVSEFQVETDTAIFVLALFADRIKVIR